MVKIQPKYRGEPIHLPDELILNIISFITATENPQATLYSACLLSRQWYCLAVGPLYKNPIIHGGNFSQFVDTTISVQRSELVPLVRNLDMSRLVHHSSNRLTAKLLGRFKTQLETFVAPQTSFVSNSFPALSKCTRLRRLDMSFISASFGLGTILTLLSKLPELAEVKLPKCTRVQYPFEVEALSPPLKLKSLYLPCWQATALSDISEAWRPNPPPVTNLFIDYFHSYQWLRNPIHQLICCFSRITDLTLRGRTSQDWHVSAFRFILKKCRMLERLSMPAVLLNQDFLEAAEEGPHPHQLKVLELTSVRHTSEWKGLSALAGVISRQAALKNVEELRISREVLQFEGAKDLLDDLEALVGIEHRAYTLRCHIAKLRVNGDVTELVKPLKLTVF